jgi:hypothetical protein
MLRRVPLNDFLPESDCDRLLPVVTTGLPQRLHMPLSGLITKTDLAGRYGGEPLSIQVRKRSTSSAGQRPSQGMVPAASLS